MAVLKLSQIASAGSPPALTDTVIGVGSGTTDLQYTLTQIKSTVAPVGANPTATGSDTAVNGSAATFMRSDGAPAIQKTSSSVFGLCKVDGSTVTATAGVISAVGGVATSIDAAGGTSITNGTSTHVLYDNAAVVGESSQFTIVSGQPNVLSGKAYLYNTAAVITADPSNTNYWFGGAGNLSASGQQNFGALPFALSSLTTGGRNVAIGFNAMGTATADNNSVAIGFNTLGNINSSSVSNLAIGSGSMSGATGGSNNVGVGANTLAANSGSGNMAIGQAALQHNIGASSNVAIGDSCLNVNTTGAQNVGVGTSALFQNNDADNVAIGFSALQGSATGGRNVAIGSTALSAANGAGGNIGIGYFAFQNAISGNFNIGIGYITALALTSGSSNIIIGYEENQITSGSNNISIGNSVAVASATASNQLVIGNYIYGTGLAGTGGTISTAKIGIGIKAPGFNLDVAGSIGQADAAALIHTTGALNNGAGTGTGVTFTNAPGASAVTGNPTKWIPIDDNGTTRYVPAF